MPSAKTPRTKAFRRVVDSWTRRDWMEFGALVSVIAILHVVGFGSLALLIAPHDYAVGTQVFGVGLGVTAYTFGLRHAFDVDHIAAIDNTTRKLIADGRRPKSVGFWFAAGHAAMVFVMALLVIAGTRAAGELIDDESPVRQILGTAGTATSGLFLYLIGAINLVALRAIWRIFRESRRGGTDEAALDAHLDNRGLMARIVVPMTRRIRSPLQLFPVGMLFGLGFDTATEVALLALAGTGAAAGLPWYAVLVLPLLFAAGMTLMDTVDGLFMTVAYDWAFADPARKIFYNLTITGLSVAVALVIGTVELVTVVHEDLRMTDPLTEWISSISLNNIGFVVVGMFAATWMCAIGYWRLSGAGRRWRVGSS